MKHILFFTIAFFSSVCMFTSCDDDDNGGSSGTPVIRYLRATDAAKSDSLITASTLGSTIAIIGENLSSVKEVWFNDQAAKLNPVYITDNAILVTIPSEIPEEKNDLIRLIAKGGKEVTYGFEVNVPAPSLASMKCEYVPDEGIAVIYGDYFVDPVVYFSGNQQAEIVDFTKTELQVKVPPGAKAGAITVETAYGTTRSTFAFRDNNAVTPTTFLFLDFEDTSWNNWNRGEFLSEDGVTGKYLRMKGATGSWVWPADALQLYYNNPTRQPVVTQGEIDNLALRFEFNSLAWSDTPMMLWFSNKLETHDVDGDEPQAHWTPYLKNGVKSDYVTDGWITVTIPLSDFKYNKDETAERSITSLSELIDLHIIMFGPADDVSQVEVWMDNFRIVAP